ncbi:MAG: PAS domain S-box protein [bacterium]|nr:PAS domain S-box protein [bacterium]
MNAPLDILLVSPSTEGISAMAQAFRDAGHDVRIHAAPSLEDATRDLERTDWAAVLMDHTASNGSPLAAFTLFDRVVRETPFIVLADSIDGEDAVALVRCGVRDCIPPNDFERLVPAVERELREAEVRRERRAAEQALLRRDAILQAVAFAAECFLKSESWEKVLPEVLARLGLATGAARAYVLRNSLGPRGEMLASRRYEWTGAGMEVHLDDALRHGVSCGADGLGAWGEMLRAGEVVVGHPHEAPPLLRALLTGQGIVSCVLVPVFVNNEWWGSLGLDERREGRSWPPAETEVLRAAAGTLAAAVQDERVRQELRQSTEKIRAILAESLDAIVIVDIETGHIITTNGAVQRVLKREDATLQGAPLSAIHPSLSQARLLEWRNRFRERRHILESIEVKRLDQTCLIELTATPIPWEAGKAVLVTLRDVTERERSEEERIRLVQAVEQAVESVVVTDVDGTIQYVNGAFERVTGYSRAEAVGGNPRILKSGVHDDAFYESLWQTITQGDVWRGRLRNKRKDGSLFTEETTISPIRDHSGRLINYVAVKQDVTQQLALEQQLQQSQKMQAIGTLAGGIAHDFNNILFAMLGFAELGLQWAEPGSKLYDCFRQVVAGGQRATDLVKQILTFSRQSEQERHPIELHLVLKEVLKLLRGTLPSTIQFRQRIEADCGYVLADPTQIHQVAMNLCTNAYHAMRETGGVLQVALAAVDVDEAFAHEHRDLEPGPHVRLSVTDNGPGMDAKTRERAFEPYFTTKKAGEGTGMGLATVHGIVKTHGGSVSVWSEPGKGTRFDLYFPCYVEADTSPEAGHDESRPRGGFEEVLFVDDEEPIVELGEILLADLGYRVTACTSSGEALRLFSAQPRRFSVVITDQTMPQLTGVELAQKALGIRPDIPIILCTGFSEAVNEEKAKAIGIRAYLKKPIIQRDLARAIRHALDGNDTPLP